MFIAHIGVALAAKRAAPRTSLGTLFLSAQFLDLVWPIMLLLGFEHTRVVPGNTAVSPLDFYDYPITHSLLGAGAWSAALGTAYWISQRYRQGAWTVAIAALSHWILDAMSHPPDLPLVPGAETKVGLGLWNSRAATVGVEGGLFLAGLALFLGVSRAKDGIGCYGFGVLMAVFLALYVGSLFGPPPPTAEVVAWTSLAVWLFVPLASWIDRHRRTDAV